MIITASSVQLSAAHVSERVTARRETMELWVGERPPAAAPAAVAPRLPPAPADRAHGHGDGRDEAEGEDGAPRAGSRHELDLAILLKTFRLGRPLTKAADEVRSAYADGAQRAEAATAAAGQPQPQAQGTPAAAAGEGWGLRYDLTETTLSAERTTFAAAARVTTADGRTIAAAAALSMERVELTRREVQVRAGDAARVDPLVLDLAGAPAAFAGRGAFDLDADGAAEQVATLAPGAAYLAMDRNGNGAIDSGAELFGPTTGSGFGELAALDGDGNGWVDEGDAAFRALSLWNPTTGGLASLGAAGVGALYTGRVATPFELRDGGAAVAAVAETGLFLREDGTAGALQHVDLMA